MSARIPPEPDMSWSVRAACRNMDTDIFFPEIQALGPKGAAVAVAEARRVCVRCPVRDECLGYVMGMSSSVPGVWGGTTETERRNLKRPGWRSGHRVNRSSNQQQPQQGA